MAIASVVRESFDRSFALYRDLIDSVTDDGLISKLPQLPSNTLGQQLWCVVGARESYGRAIEANRWCGFSCSLESADQKHEVAEGLRRSEEALLNVLRSIETYTDVQNRLVIDLLEHEAAHHGQLIRYLYGLKLTIPESWKSRYALT